MSLVHVIVMLAALIAATGAGAAVLFVLFHQKIDATYTQIKGDLAAAESRLGSSLSSVASQMSNQGAQVAAVHAVIAAPPAKVS